MRKVLIMCALMFALTGCGSKEEEKPTETVKTDKEIVLEAYDKMKSLDSFELDIAMNLDYTSNGEQEKDLMSANVLVDRKNKAVKSTSINKTGDEEYIFDSYARLKDNSYISYNMRDGKWVSTNVLKKFDSDKMLSMIIVSTEIKKETDDKYELILPKESIEKVLQTYNLYEICKVDTVKVYAFVKDGYVTEIGLTASIDYLEEDITYTGEAKLFSKFSKMNELEEVKIPDEVINNAISEDVES